MKGVIILFFVLFSLFSFSQSIEFIKADRNTYIWGEGSGTTIKKADNEALASIISQISTEVESSFSMLKNEETQGDESAYTETVNSVVKTYSNASLKNTERIVISNEPDAKVFRYIKRSEIDKIFEARKQKIIGFTSNGIKSLENLQISDALRYYYWALTLLRSHPDGSSISIKLNDGSNQLLATYLPFQISQILGKIEAKVVGIEDRQNYKQAILNITYQGKPVSNLDYSYFDGRNYSNVIGAKDGFGYIDLPSTGKMESVDFKVEYIFENEAAVDNELRDVMTQIDPVPFRASYFKLSTDVVDKETAKTIEESTDTEMISLLDKTDSYVLIVDDLCKAIYKENYTSAKTLCTTEGYKLFVDLLQYGNAKILSTENLNFVNYGDKVVCRAVKMSFNFANNTRSFVEDVVFTFDDTKKICDITFGLGQTAIDDIIKQENWSEAVRLNIIDFMEHYKTAFALKNLEYIRSIFSDDALIVTGWVLKVKSPENNPYLNNEIVKYNRHSKEEYLKNLSYSFQSKEFINLKFNDNNIRKSGKGGEVYGIQIQQDYFSSNYGDSGYLFLLIDFNDSTQPEIHVRTWQPEKNADGSIYGVGDF